MIMAKQTRQDKRAARAQDFANQKIKSASDFNFDQHNRKGVEGTHVSGQEARHVSKAGGFRDGLAALQAQKDAGATFGKRAEGKFNRMTARAERLDARKDERQAARQEAKERAQNAKKQPEQNLMELPQPGETGNQQAKLAVMPPTNNQEQTAKIGDQTQKVNQDNDVNNTVTGDNNYTNINQDNSVRQYGGDNRIFQYQSNGNPATDTPASMATLGGFYDVDDSPAKQAKFQDLYSTLNSDAQKKYSNTSHIAQGAIAQANRNSTLDAGAMDARIYNREQYSRAKADQMGMNLFGDMYKGNGPSWQTADPQKPVETPDFEKMYDKYSKF